MDSNIKYNNEIQTLTEEFIDIGYMAENIDVQMLDGTATTISRSHEDGAMTLFISFPNTEEEFVKEMFKIDQFMSDIQVPIYCYFIFSKINEDLKLIDKNLQKFDILIDSEQEYGLMYGAQIVDGTLQDLLTKSLFLISKDGAIFYLQIPKDLNDVFDFESLQIQLNKAYVTYTGVGCHG